MAGSQWRGRAAFDRFEWLISGLTGSDRVTSGGAWQPQILSTTFHWGPGAGNHAGCPADLEPSPFKLETCPIPQPLVANLCCLRYILCEFGTKDAIQCMPISFFLIYIFSNTIVTIVKPWYLKIVAKYYPCTVSESLRRIASPRCFN